MIARQSLLRTVARSSTASSSAPSAARTFASSSKVRGDAHSSGSGGAQGAQDDVYTHESFATPFFRNTALFLLASIGIYRFSQIHADPHPSRASSSGKANPQNESEDSHHDELQGENRPYLTRWMEQWMQDSEKNAEHAREYLDISRQKAERRAFFADVERPPVYRYRGVQRLDNESPHCRIPGDAVDFSNITAKRVNE